MALAAWRRPPGRAGPVGAGAAAAAGSGDSRPCLSGGGGGGEGFGFSLQRAEYMEVMTHIGQQEVDILQPAMALEADGLLRL